MFEAIDRRDVLRGISMATPLAALACKPSVLVGSGDSRELPEFFTDLEYRTFRFFWETTNPETGLVLDRWPTPSFSSIAAIGFGITAYILGAERGWISREQACDRILRTLRFLSHLPMGEAASGVAGHRGFFYHFLNAETGLRHGRTELSTVDTGLFHLGALHAIAWSDRNSVKEAEIRALGTELVERAEWDWFQRENKAIPMGWHPESGFIERNWEGYNEGKLVYILALGSTSHPARDGSWDAWTATYADFWRGEGEQRWLAFAPLWPGQYSEMWIDFRGIQDAPMREAGIDYFENGRREARANQQWCAANPMGWDGYAHDMWGLCACDGPGSHREMRNGREVQFRGYSARGPADEPDGFDDGTIAPTAAISAIPFVPELGIAAALAMKHRYGSRIYGRYGFLDAFNPSFRDTSLRVEYGTVDAQAGWVAGDYLGIDQGTILGMLGNYRSEAIWQTMRKSPMIVRGLRRAGFVGGWLESADA